MNNNLILFSCSCDHEYWPARKVVWVVCSFSALEQTLISLIYE